MEEESSASRRAILKGMTGVAFASAFSVAGASPSSTEAETAQEITTVFDMNSKTPLNFPGGVAHIVRQSDFPMMTDSSCALVTIDVNSYRSPHWHSTWELQLCMSGTAKLYWIDSKGGLFTGDMKAGSIAFVQGGQIHAIENTGTGPCQFFFSWPTPNMEDFDIASQLGGFPDEMLKAALGVDMSKRIKSGNLLSKKS